LRARLAGSILAVCTLLATGMLVNMPQSAASPELVALLQDVTTADGRRYGTTDDRGVGMDTAKIVPGPPGDGYLAVYHHLVGGVFNVRLATSTDLLHWHYVATLENDASQPTIAALSGGGFLVAYEKTGRGAYCGGSGSCLAFQHYPNMDALLAGAEDRSVAVNRTLSPCNEGTPNIYAATLHPDLDHSIINVGFHYFKGCDVDRQAIGTLTNFSSWKAQADSNLNTRFTNLGTIGGNVGDRDALHYQGRPYSLVEGQDTKNDFGTWLPVRANRQLTDPARATHAWRQHLVRESDLHRAQAAWGQPGVRLDAVHFLRGSRPRGGGPTVLLPELPHTAGRRYHATDRHDHAAGTRRDGPAAFHGHDQRRGVRQLRYREGGVLRQRCAELRQPVRALLLHLDGPEPLWDDPYPQGRGDRRRRQRVVLVGDRHLPVAATSAGRGA
jgi:hypothetical protein